MHRSGTSTVALAWLAALLSAACASEETRRCHTLMGSAQEIVKGVDAKDLGSVEQSLSAVQAAWEACDKAGRTGERDELTHAKNELSGHAEFLKRKAARPPSRKKRTPEELAQVALHGDPTCPKGQAYREDGAGKEIRCVGPQLSDLGFGKADEYFRGRGFKITATDSPPTLRAEYGAELYVYTYAAPKDDHPPRCLALYPAPGVGFQEAVGRVTGAPLKRIDKSGTVETDRGKLPLRVEESETKLIVYIGDCG